MGKPFFIVPTTNLSHITLSFLTQSVSRNFCGHTLLVKGTKSAFIVHFNEFWQLVAGKEIFRFLLKQPTTFKEPLKRAAHVDFKKTSIKVSIIVRGRAK